MIEGMQQEMADYLARHPDDEGRLEHLLDQMKTDDDIGSRSNMKGHVVSSILTLSVDRSAGLLIHHAAYDLWIPPGGHYEGGTLHASGMRERAEETGVSRSRPYGGGPAYLLDVDTHPIASRPAKNEGPHWHHDFMYLEMIDEDHEIVLQADEIKGGEFRDIRSFMTMGSVRMNRLAHRVMNLPSSGFA